MTNFDDSQIEKILDQLKENTKLKIPWIQRKETAAWACLIFYYAILWSLGGILSNSKVFGINLAFFIFFLTVLLIFFSSFIHTQYASIYYMSASASVYSRIILDIIVKKAQFFSEHNISNGNDLSHYINYERENEINNNVQKFRGKLHPIKILIYFWSYILIFPAIKIFNLNKLKLSNHERAEAALYSMLLLGYIFFLCFKLKNSA